MAIGRDLMIVSEMLVWDESGEGAAEHFGSD
ncbi:hypothetical protein MARHY2926 [Marinobacter nauticus ATCC 49840]|nr:hypothetical protein MARHY2926 [Marinobacter nauticus ATCC 49840]